MFSIDLIQWPKSANSAIHFYLGFLVWVLDALKINFSAYENDPICTIVIKTNHVNELIIA